MSSGALMRRSGTSRIASRVGLVTRLPHRISHQVDALPGHVRVDPAGTDRIHLDVVRRELRCERAHEPEQTCLRRGVARVAGNRDAREDRRDHHDVAPLRPGREPALRRANAVVGADEVRGDEIVEAVLGAGLVRARRCRCSRRARARGRSRRPQLRKRPRPGPRRECRSARTKAPPISDAVCASASSPRAISERRAPSFASRSAIALPIPRPAPVTTTCRPSTGRSVISLRARPVRRRPRASGRGSRRTRVPARPAAARRARARRSRG